MSHEIYREALRNYRASLTRLGITTFRLFRGPGLPGDHDYMICMVHFAPQPDCSSEQDYGKLPLIRSIDAAVAIIPWNDNNPEETERAHKAARTNREAHDIWEFLYPQSPSPSQVPHMVNRRPPPAAAEADEDATGAVLRTWDRQRRSSPIRDTASPPYRDNFQTCTSLNPDGIIITSDLVVMFQLLHTGQPRGHLHILQRRTPHQHSPLRIES